MNRDEQQNMMFLADMLHGEINRMCVTDNCDELDMMFIHAIKNIDKFHAMRTTDIISKRYKFNTVKQEKEEWQKME
jgi:hypothetical protein